MIHPSAIISPSAEVGSNVSIGPLTVVEAGAKIGDGCQIESHVVIKGSVELGENNIVGTASVLGGAPQHLVPAEGTGRVVIGNGNIFREYVTIHHGYGKDAVTRIGDKNLLMVNSHAAHDCAIGNSTIIANNVMLAGHVRIDDSAYLAGAVGVHQFCHIGRNTMVGGQSAIKKDVPPFVTVDGDSNQLVGLNSVGLRRNGFAREDIRSIKEAYNAAFGSNLPWGEMLEQLLQTFPTGYANEFARFLAESERGCIRERRSRTSPTIRFPADGEKPNLRRVG